MDITEVKASIGNDQGNIELCHKVLDYSDVYLQRKLEAGQ